MLKFIGLCVVVYVLRDIYKRLTRKSVEGKIVLITGGGSGIGRLMAVELAKQKAVIVIWDISKEGLAETEKQVQAVGGRCHSYICDVSSYKTVYEVADKVKAEVGRVNILINNAGIVSGKKFWELSEQQITKTFEVNTVSHFWTSKAFLPDMIKADEGHLVTISSAAGIVGVAVMADYCASKFAAFGFDESIRAELRKIKSKVCTTVVCPYYIDTGMFDGVRTRFPLLMPILKPDYVVGKIIDSIRREDSMLCMPRFIYLGFLARAILPTAVADWANHFLGVSSSMDEFKGRMIKKD